MIIKDISFKNFVANIKEKDRKIIIYGNGVIGKAVLPYYLNETGLSNRVLFTVDIDANKQDCKTVYPIDHLSKAGDDAVILISGSRYKSMLEMLEKMNLTKKADVYIFPEMILRENNHINGKVILKRASDTPLIPKKIHYCWFGDKQIPERLKKCMESWQRECPDYEIIRWSEENYDLNRYLYTKQAYENKKWAYIPDIARLEILYENGGIYLDTDVEIKKSFDELLYQKGFVGVEKWGVVNIGGGCGAIKNHPMIKKILDFRSGIKFVNDNGSINTESSGYYETAPFLRMGFKPDNTIQLINEIIVLSSDFFHPYDYMSKETNLTDNTYSIHHFSGNWV